MSDFSCVHQVKEFSEIDIPISELLGADGTLRIDPNSSDYFAVYRKKGKLRLEAKGHVGAFKVGDAIVVVQPRAPLRSFSRMLHGDDKALIRLGAHERTYGQEDETARNPFEILLWNLLDVCKPLLSEGPWKPYSRVEKSGSEPVGTWDFSKSFRQHWSRGIFHKAVTVTHRQLVDNSANRVIRAALAVAKRYEDTIGRVFSDSQRRTWRELFDVLGPASLSIRPRDLESADWDYRLGRFQSSRAFYYDILPVALDVLRGTTPDIRTLGATSTAGSFAISMPDLFERYLLRVLKGRRSEVSPSTRFQDGNNEGKRSLYKNKEDPKVTPDYVISVNGRAAGVMDAKYMWKVKKEDRYQIITHAVAYGVRLAVLVLPRNSNRRGLFHVGNVGEAETVSLYEYRFDLAEDDFEAEEKALIEAVSGLVNGSPESWGSSTAE